MIRRDIRRIRRDNDKERNEERHKENKGRQ